MFNKLREKQVDNITTTNSIKRQDMIHNESISYKRTVLAYKELLFTTPVWKCKFIATATMDYWRKENCVL